MDRHWARRFAAGALAALGLSLPGVESHGGQLVARRVEIRCPLAAGAPGLRAPARNSSFPIEAQASIARMASPLLGANERIPRLPDGPLKNFDESPGKTVDAEPRASAETIYGPFHRLGDTAKTLERILASGELWGKPPRGIFASDIPAAKAFPGPLPPGARGFEFTTPVAPDDSRGGSLSGIKWTGPRPGVEVEPYSLAKIPITVTKVSETDAPSAK